jgi:hypothetical protein
MEEKREQIASATGDRGWLDAIASSSAIAFGVRRIAKSTQQDHDRSTRIIGITYDRITIACC